MKNLNPLGKYFKLKFKARSYAYWDGKFSFKIIKCFYLMHCAAPTILECVGWEFSAVNDHRMNYQVVIADTELTGSLVNKVFLLQGYRLIYKIPEVSHASWNFW